MNNDTKHEAQGLDVVGYIRTLRMNGNVLSVTHTSEGGAGQFQEGIYVEQVEPLCRLSDATAVIDQLSEKVVQLESQQSAPAGYVMVPVEMTQEMYLVFCEERGKHGSTFRSAYKAMLAAAPKAEPQPVSDDARVSKMARILAGKTIRKVKA